MSEVQPLKPDQFLPTRRSLLSRIKNWEDQASWRDFYDTYWRVIYEVARKAGLREEEAKEALQETVLAVANEIKTFDYDPVKGSFKAWLLQQTRWRIADQFRKRNRHERRIQEPLADNAQLEELPDPATESVPDDLWDKEYYQNMLRVAEERVRSEVEPKTFQAYQLQTKQGWPAEKTAATLRISRTQVYVAKHRVQNRLIEEVRRLERQAARPAIEILEASK